MHTFFGILEPFDELLHLFDEMSLSFGRMGLSVPLEDHVFTQHIRCFDKKANNLLKSDIWKAIEKSLNYRKRGLTFVEKNHNLLENLQKVHILVTELLNADQ